MEKIFKIKVHIQSLNITPKGIQFEVCNNESWSSLEHRIKKDCNGCWLCFVKIKLPI